MSTPSPSIIDPKTEDPKTLGWAGGLLFALGLVACFLALVQGADATNKVNMVLYAAILLSLGYPMLLYVRALHKIVALEQRIRDLEQRPRS